jgi:UDP-N-acetyl-2-amino-2-deoxyglucuronate dehydrogenase
VAVVDINVQRAQEIASKHGVDWHTDYREMLERKDLDVAFVMTPSGMHGQMAIDAAQAGKDVIVTKPMEVTLEKADRMIRVCRDCGVKLAIDFEQRYVLHNLKIKRAIEDGKLGKLVLGEVRMKWYRAQKYYEGWHGTWEMDGGGSLINQAIHWIDLLLWFMGPVDTVFGHTGVFTHQIETEDLGVAVLTFKNGAMGTVLGTTTWYKDDAPVVEVHGKKGYVGIKGAELALWEFTSLDSKRFTEEFEEGLPEHWPANVVEDMIGVLREGKEPVVDGSEGRKSLELVKAIYESSGTEKVVKLPIRLS